jgi:hypothetical protein
MLLVYDSNGSLLYEELLDRCGPKERQYMGTVNDLDGLALVVNVCEPFKLILKEAKQLAPADVGRTKH